MHRAVLLEHATKNEDYPEGELRGGVQEVVGVGEHASRAAARGRVLECVAVWRY
ncbi:MAG: hypothetical protein ACO2OQ_02475 [Thermofilaceae archaeon]